MTDTGTATVGCWMTAQIADDGTASTTVELQIGVARGRALSEQLLVTLDGRPQDVVELDAGEGGRLHRFACPPGLLAVAYDAVVSAAPEAVRPVGPLEDSVYLRPSRYAESDRLGAVARLVGSRDPLDVAAWVHQHLRYELGSSGPTDGAVATLLAGAGVCRDHAHLVVALLRSLDVPARVASAYAPGLAPMDFHAVAEALVDGSWQVVDATGLAPRGSLVRIATGRDAADTAFLSSWGAPLTLETLQVTAVAERFTADDPPVPAALP